MAQDFIIRNGVLEKYTGSGEDVVIPEGVIIIGGDVFRTPYAVLKSVVIPEGVIEIERRAFFGCGALEKVTFPESLKRIGWMAFADCTNLKEVIIPNGVEVIESIAFKGCTGIAYAHISESVKEIGEDAFRGCIGLKNIDLPDNLQKAKDAFMECNIDVRVKHWSSAVSKALQYCLVNKVFTDDFSSVPAKFRTAAALGIYSEKNADEEEKAKAAKFLSKNAVKIMETAIVNPELLHVLLDNKLLSSKDITTYVEAVNNAGNTEMVAELMNYQNSMGVEKVKHAQKKKTEDKEEYSEKRIQRMAMRDPDKGIAGMTFVITGTLSDVWKSRKELQAYLESYGAKLGGGISKKTDYLVANSKETASDKYIKAKELDVPIITEREFNKLIGRKYDEDADITIPAWVRSIPYSACSSNKKVTYIHIPSNIEKIEAMAFYDCINLKEIELSDSVEEIEADAFSGCISLETVSLSQNLRNIGSGAFMDCKSLETIVLPKSIENISASMFRSCEKITTLPLHSGIKTIESRAFELCNGLREVTIPDSVQEIQEGAFTRCDNLKTVILSKSIRYLSPQLFDSCGSLEQVILTDSIETIDAWVFYDCRNLSKIMIPDSVKTIGEKAFFRCESLEELRLSENISSIGIDAFKGCDKLTIHTPAGSYAEQYANEHSIPVVNIEE